MPDDKSGREKQADDADKRQRERAIAEELERGDEQEPLVDEQALADFGADLESLTFPATGSEVVTAVGDSKLEAVDGDYTVEELIPDTDRETFESPAEVGVRVQRPTVAAAMKRIVEAGRTLPKPDRDGSQRNAYEKTLRELAGIDADDDDEGVRVLSDWIVEYIREEGKRPGSRAVRRKAAEFCRSQGYEIRNDEWLGV